MINETMNTEQSRVAADCPNERPVMPEPPFCAWCGGTCHCEDHYDEYEETDFCDCLAVHDEEELASNCCSCCGGYIEA